MISIIVPVYNEADGLPGWLEALFEQHAVAECYVLDASDAMQVELLDAELEQRVRVPFLHYLSADKKGRAQQMNQGAEMSTGSVLLFLHADTGLPNAALKQIQKAIDSGAHWGRFNIHFDHPGRAYRMIAAMMNWRSRVTGIATGDQAMFMTRGAYDLVGGFDDISLMEDVAMSKKLKSIGPPICLEAEVETSARRWQQKGILRTILLMWWLRFAYWIGVSPAKLQAWYR